MELLLHRVVRVLQYCGGTAAPGGARASSIELYSVALMAAYAIDSSNSTVKLLLHRVVRVLQ
eukprot:11394-Heterococcus_DN1.PRE.1